MTTEENGFNVSGNMAKNACSPSEKTSESNSESSPLLSNPRTRLPLFSAAFSASLFVVLFGMVIGYAAPATVDMTKPGSRFRSIITARDIAWISSTPSLSGILGNLLAGE